MEQTKKFTTNKYGISIVKCCASCRFKQLDNRTRLCLAGEGAVPASYVCHQWEISPSLENVGKGGGKVKNGDYLHYSLDRMVRDANEAEAAIHNGKSHRRITMTDIRKEYLKYFGDIYIIGK